MSKVNYIVCVLCCILCGCNSDENTIELNSSLSELVDSNEIEIDNVIACASGSASDDDVIIAYVYPRPGATDIRYYETSGIDVDKNDYNSYQRILIESTDFFNGYLRKFTRNVDEEKWVIITFFEEGKLHLSNPIRLKHKTSPTEFTDQVNIDFTTANMPVFTWQDGMFDDNAIYFQVVSDIDNELLSGTYTFEKQFQYYKTENVVLNITMGIPPQLDTMSSYNFTLMGVSEDNWVNLLIQKEFQP
ncbi:hypothetical protein [Aquimarina litoralis]|uniref:hypothetical protein n=1 Tax=Aquimarina litoralis TaxID=584605 RepID=UPI001FE9C799|nr:hypothetical protein [Aquimarina litoralis]MBW1295423.1 hypothetical protein [Aquimarina litoralis]